ncbi:copper chaperone PCu(A)C [Actinobacillus delphinicola]|uniref:Uncharacterized protein conserved in bacteria n=1 Tax=Actinobacillus delphinicola TaxID=51161 RepID=A0A448TRX4_9PAST|nr:copper chaperone PCu(A)C [Actinobacillus delphinicola]VEJ08740.1 Uncharacterized protein conserved in bacteria [Actinobacillus delphinicola]
MKKILTTMAALAPAFLFAQVTVQQPTIAATTQANQPTAIHMTLKNNGNEKVNLVMLETASNARLELHGMKNGRMSPISEIPVPAHGETKLKYGGMHIMVYDLTHPIAVGSTFPVTLFFDNGETLNIKAKAVSPQEMHLHK